MYSYAEFHSHRAINVESVGRNSFKLPSKSEVTKELIAVYQSLAASCLFVRGHFVRSRPFCSFAAILFVLGHFARSRPVVCSFAAILFVRGQLFVRSRPFCSFAASCLFVRDHFVRSRPFCSFSAILFVRGQLFVRSRPHYQHLLNVLVRPLALRLKAFFVDQPVSAREGFFSHMKAIK